MHLSEAIGAMENRTSSLLNTQNKENNLVAPVKISGASAPYG